MRSSASVSWCLLSVCHFLFAASSCFIIFLSVPPIVILYHKASRYICLNHGGHLTCSFYISVFPFASCLPAILFMDHSAHRRWHMYIKRSFFNCFSLSLFFFFARVTEVRSFPLAGLACASFATRLFSAISSSSSFSLSPSCAQHASGCFFLFTV